MYYSQADGTRDVVEGDGFGDLIYDHLPLDSRGVDKQVHVGLLQSDLDGVWGDGDVGFACRKARMSGELRKVGVTGDCEGAWAGGLGASCRCGGRSRRGLGRVICKVLPVEAGQNVGMQRFHA